MQISMNAVLIMVDAIKTVTTHLEVSIVHVTLDTVWAAMAILVMVRTDIITVVISLSNKLIYI